MVKKGKNLPPLSWCSSEGVHQSGYQVGTIGQMQGGDWQCPGLHRTCRELGHDCHEHHDNQCHDQELGPGGQLHHKISKKQGDL